VGVNIPITSPKTSIFLYFPLSSPLLNLTWEQFVLVCLVALRMSSKAAKELNRTIYSVGHSSLNKERELEIQGPISIQKVFTIM